jgi:F0F1-type ATP synthase membrane subunit a
MAISHEHPTSPTDPNQGLNVRIFLISVFVAAVVVAVILFVAVGRKGTKVVPTPTQTTSPTSQLIQPKPSPLHSRSCGRPIVPHAS